MIFKIIDSETINTKIFYLCFYLKIVYFCEGEKIKIMNQTYNAINLQHAIQPISSKWGLVTFWETEKEQKPDV